MFSMLIISATTLFTACSKKEEVAPKPTTGGLVVKVKLDGSTGFLSNVGVGLATSKANLDNSVYLQDKVTNTAGQVDFGQLNPANYYYDCEAVVGSDTYYGEGQIQVVAGTNLELTLTLTEQ